MKKKFLVYIMASLFILPFFVYAQSQEITGIDEWVPENTISNEELEELDEFLSAGDWAGNIPSEDYVDCFDYYNFQSAQVSLGTEKKYYKPGDVVKVHGTVLNENDYPVFDGNVFVRVTQRNGNYESEGNYLVDEFFGAEDIAIAAGESKEISFEWTIPKSAPSTEYAFDFFFTVGKKFNLAGLPFSNEIVASSTKFDVIAKDLKSFISFDRSNTKINGNKYYHIGDWPVFNGDDRVVITQPLVNAFSEEKDIDITYELYYWDSLKKEDMIDIKQDKIRIAGKSAKDLEYIIPKVKETVYYLKITAQTEGQKSIVNIRLVSNQQKPRLNYPSITRFPLKENQRVTLFSCFHNTSGINSEGKVEIILEDKSGKEVSRIDYKGNIPSSMSAAKMEFVANKDYEYLKLKANLYDKNEKLVDSYEVIYDCDDINKCEKKNLIKNPDILNIVKNILFVLFILLFVSVIVFVIIKKIRN